MATQLRLIIATALILSALEGSFGLTRAKIHGPPASDGEVLKQEPLECLTVIKNGTVHGMKRQAAHSRPLCSYERLPYAAPPTGEKRFKPPQPAEPWGDWILNATTLPFSCAQDSPAVIPASEDCLYLNVYTRHVESTDPVGLPVMVWFHGGGFTSGESSYYGSYKLLGAADVVLVIVQYRLGPFGFLSTGDEASPGNYGLKDMVQSLRWVQENIEAFGGDPNQVTVFGESAGGAISIFMLLSPLAHGLFHRVISQSGVPIAEWSLDRKPRESAQLMAARLGCPTEPSEALVSCMRELRWEDIVLEQEKYESEAYSRLDFGLATVTPTIEPDLPGAFITKEPLEILQTGYLPDVPVIIGATKHEGSYILGELYVAKIGPENLTDNAVWMRDRLIPELLKTFGVDEGTGSGSVPSSVGLAFMEPGLDRGDWESIMPGLVDLMTVFFMKAPILRVADILSERLSNVYLYSFEHHGAYSMWSLLFLGIAAPPITHGITHSDDLIYLFNIPFVLGPQDTAFATLFCELWTNFAIHGNPTPTETDKHPIWPKYNVTDQLYMKLNNTPTVMRDFRSSWNPRGFEHN